MLSQLSPKFKPTKRGSELHDVSPSASHAQGLRSPRLRINLCGILSRDFVIDSDSLQVIGEGAEFLEGQGLGPPFGINAGLLEGVLNLQA